MLWMFKSSINTLNNFCIHFANILTMVCENILVTFVSPNGITNHSYNLDFLMNAIFLTSFGFILICQNPLCHMCKITIIKLMTKDHYFFGHTFNCYFITKFQNHESECQGHKEPQKQKLKEKV